MADIADTLKGLLGAGAEDKIKDVLDTVTVDDGQRSVGKDAELTQLRAMLESMTMNKNDPRANLLMSLKPYMREERQQSVESAVKLMGIFNIIKMLGK